MEEAPGRTGTSAPGGDAAANGAGAMHQGGAPDEAGSGKGGATAAAPATDASPSAAPDHHRTPSRPDVASPRREVLLVDLPQTRVRRPGDLLALVLAVLGIGAVLILAVYANATTHAVTEDVQTAVAGTVRQVLLLPVTVLEGLVTFFLPIAVLADRLLRRSWRSAVEVIVAGVGGALLTELALLGLDALGPSNLTNGLAVTTEGSRVIAMNPYAAALAGLLTAVGDRSRHRLVGWSWGLLWVVLGLAVVQGNQTLPGVLVTVLLGRVAGLGVRYASGVLHDRATGISLVRGLRRAGADPVRVVRLDPLGQAGARAWTVTTAAPIGYTERLREPQRPDPRAGRERPGAPDEPARRERTGATAYAAAAAGRAPSAAAGRAPSAAPGLTTPTPATATAATPTSTTTSPSPADLLAAVDQEAGDTIVPDALTDPAQALAEAAPAGLQHEEDSPHRVYAVWDAQGRRLSVSVLDGDRHVVGMLTGLWDSIRLRGHDRRPTTTLRQAANRAALLTLAARAAGVRTPELVGITEARDSVIIVTEHVPDARRLDELAPAEVDEDVLDDVWRQVTAAHAAGLAHRDLQAAAFSVDRAGRVWLRDWENGEIISSELSRRIDLAQLLAMLAVLVGTDRAVASAARVLTREQLASIAPLLQPVVMPYRTRAASSDHRALLAALREELVEEVPRADVAPLQLNRFSVRTVVTVTLAVVAVWLLVSRFNFEEVASAVRAASPAWMVVAFVAGLLTYVGSAVALVAFSPERLALWRTVLVQIAASVVSLVAPAGIGPAALNLRYLNTQRISTPLAVATVGLVQVSQFVTTVLLLVAVALVTGSVGSLSAPSGSVLAAVALVVVVLGALLLVPPLRAWVWAKVGPTLEQVWPRLVWVSTNPRRITAAVLGNLLMTAGYVTAFGASLAAFGQSLPLTSLAITYLASNSVGAVVPSPGGIGPVELALTTGLSVAGIPYATALSVAILFRLLTFWGRVPIGWAALRHLQKRGVL
ncbi:flippase-like domain-containing protein [Georgenia sp. TF02-10]|uniref:lysylphosphatidylglycerol synthase transmembrane domain-containing protein n=1 Tax=Georgenia sp. TF02-10 TaxID=2917725 RepID=UPI001FA738D1|nr:lysylphosphatidylglycerol synthase transmembrane domain-containing protein [Georgenia sp. TF02-10]UNX54743.1 flippase-like domain-containing protein [Georgenia sp. TF02-10]